MKRIILVTALVAVSIAVISLTSAQQRPTMTPEQLQRVQIRPVPGKDGLYVIPGFDGNMSGGSIAVLVTGEGVIIDPILDDVDFRAGVAQPYGSHMLVLGIRQEFLHFFVLFNSLHCFGLPTPDQKNGVFIPRTGFCEVDTIRQRLKEGLDCILRNDIRNEI